MNFSFPNKQLAVLQLRNRHFLDRRICLTNLDAPPLIFSLSLSVFLSPPAESTSHVLSYFLIFHLAFRSSSFRSVGEREVTTMTERVSPQSAQSVPVGVVLRKPGTQPAERAVTAEAELASLERGAARVHRRSTAKRPAIREREWLVHRRRDGYSSSAALPLTRPLLLLDFCYLISSSGWSGW